MTFSDQPLEVLIRRLASLERQVENLRTQELGVTLSNSVYVPLQDYFAIFSNATLTTSDYTGTAGSFGASFPTEGTAAAVRLVAKSTAAGDWVALGPDNDNDASKYHITARCPVANQDLEINGIVAVNASVAKRFYYFRTVSGGATLTWSLIVTGYFVPNA